MLTTQFSDIKGFLIDQHKINMLSINGKYKSKKFLLNMFETLPRKNWKLYYAKYDNQIISALLLLYSDKIIEYYLIIHCVLKV